MELDAAKAVLIPVHGTLGAAALLAGGVALFARKRRGRHTRGGVAFVALMAAAIAAAIPVIVLSRNLFLGGLGAVAAYLVVAGWRLGRLRPPARAAAFDPAAAAVAMALFGGFIAFNLYFVARGQLLGLAGAGIGFLGFQSARGHRRFLRAPEQDPRDWVAHHGETMGGAFIASMTAFFAAAMTNVLPGVPEFLIWLAPIALLVPVLRGQLRRGRAA